MGGRRRLGSLVAAAAAAAAAAASAVGCFACGMRMGPFTSNTDF